VSRVRIVGGQWRSRLLNVAHAPGLRPTPDRVRETLFNWLGQDLSGLRCLDLFAGTGILGFEAASRGAEHVCMVERNPRACAALRDTAKTLQASQVELIRGDAVEFARSVRQAFDVVFLDPPYHQGWLERIEPWLDRLLQPQGWLYVECETPLARLGAWHVVRQGHAGQVHYHLLQGPSE
jgi:16S rRNA (guanine(966)-N(2))-methyltransferase RsmD